MAAYIASLLFVTLAEMGDKTQLLAMAFATRFPAPTVLAAVFCATLLNHALAVGAGRLLATVIPLELVSFIAAVSFLLFGLWTIRGDTLEGEDEKRSALGPFFTVAVAFFIAELGDKTQLATISLAVKYSSPLAVLLGTTTGMVVADGLGISLGIVLGKRLPDTLIRLVSAGVFIGFGLIGAGTVLPVWLPQAATAVVVFALAVATLGAAHVLLLQRRRRQERPVIVEGQGPGPRRLTQLLFAGLLLVGWIASLGLLRPLAAVDHWVAFVLLVGLGWKLIHWAVNPRIAHQALEAYAGVLILVLAGFTTIHAILTGFPLALAVVPASLLLAAFLMLMVAPIMARHTSSVRLRRVSRGRVAIAGGLLLVGIAVQILIEHLISTV